MNKIITLGDIFKNLETEEKAFKFKEYIIDMQKEIERLHSIIKEVREYIEEHTENVELNIYGMPPVIRAFRGNTQTLLQILDKVGSDINNGSI